MTLVNVKLPTLIVLGTPVGQKALASADGHRLMVIHAHLYVCMHLEVKRRTQNLETPV